MVICAAYDRFGKSFRDKGLSKFRFRKIDIHGGLEPEKVPRNRYVHFFVKQLYKLEFVFYVKTDVSPLLE